MRMQTMVEHGTMSQLSILWNARRTGLWQAAWDYASEHGAFPRVRLGSGPSWFRLAAKTRHRLRRMKNQWAGKTVVCVGNGPSINQTDLSCLQDAYVIGTNRAFQILDQFEPAAFHLVIQDNMRLEELQEQISLLACPVHIGSWFFAPENVPPKWVTPRKKNLSVYLPMLAWKRCGDSLEYSGSLTPRFSDDPTQGVFAAYSIIFTAIQFAYYFGAKRIVCIGIDMDYANGVSFAPGVANIFPTFDYETQCKPIFEMMKIVLDNRGIELINASPGGKVDAIPRMALKDALQGRAIERP